MFIVEMLFSQTLIWYILFYYLNIIQLQKAKEAVTVEIVEDVVSDLVEVSSKPMAETYGGDVEGITSIMKELVSQVDTQILNISSKPAAKKLVEKVSQVRTFI